MARTFLLATLLLVPVVTPAHATDRTSGLRTVPAEFTDNVNRYVEIHRAVSAALGPEVLCSEAEELFRQVSAFRAAIADARPSAKDGEIFTPAVATFFRTHIVTIVQETGFDVAAALEAEEWDREEPLDESPGLQVNGVFPWSAGSVMWPVMLSRFPPLPEELEYRFFGRHLVLIDIHASLVVDVLWDALAVNDRPVPAKPRQPCDVHRELPECWM